MVQNTHDVRDRNPHSPEPIAKDLSTDIITVPDVELGSARSPPPPPYTGSLGQETATLIPQGAAACRITLNTETAEIRGSTLCVTALMSTQAL